jgi:hypothetical protein
MKHLIMAAAAALVLVGCQTNQGRPANDTYMESPNDRRIENKASDNLRDVGRQSSPTSPFTQGNGSLNF